MNNKIQNKGRQITNLPREVVLRDAESPKEVVDALDSWREAVEGLQEPTRVLREAEEVAKESTLLVRGQRERYDAELREKTTEERAALAAAERVTTREAKRFVDVLEQHRDALGAIAARLGLEAHARAIDAAMDLDEAEKKSSVAPRVPTHPQVDPVVLARQHSTNVQDPPLARLDRVNVAALLEVCGSDPVGFVEVVETRRGFRMHTTPRRAQALVGRGTNGWRYMNEEAH
jgi:hypothetical protein